MYSTSVILALIGFDILYPSVATSFNAKGFKHSVNNLGHRASPCGNPLSKLMLLDVFYKSNNL